MNPPTAKTRFKRSRTGCFACREAKYKCNEEKPVCTRCRHNSRTCVYPPVRSRSRSRGSGSSSIQSMRPDPDLPLIPTDYLYHGLPPLDYLARIYPDPEERDLMRHFICFGTVNLCAIPQPDRPIQFFDIAYCLDHPRGSSIESDSLLLSLLSIAAAHRSSMFFQQEKGYLTTPVIGKWGQPPLLVAANSASISRYRGAASNLSKSALSTSRTAIVLKAMSGGASKETIEAVLSSILCTTISQVMTGGSEWREALEAGFELIESRGGPTGMLEEAQRVSNAALVGTRKMLELFVYVDVCRCWAHGTAPRLLTQPFQPWWFDFANDSTDPSHRDTLHYSCGMDRGMLELVNRVNMLVHEHTVLSTLPDRAYDEAHDRKVQELLLELDIWEVAHWALRNVNRVQLGNCIMIYTLRVIIHVDLLRHPHSHSSVQDAATKALESFEKARSICALNLLTPAIIVGSMMIDPAGRNQARSVFDALRVCTSYSYDVEVGSRILEKLYSLRDEGQIDPCWRTQMGDVLLL